MRGERAGRAASAAWTMLLDSGLLDRVRRRRPAPLPEFLEALVEIGPDAVLDDPSGVGDALLHLGRQWATTTETLAQPATLPAVVERRERLRVHPVATYATAGTSAAGTAVVVAGSAPIALEAIAVVGIVGATGLLSGWAWRPHARRRDRSFTVGGVAALTARSQALLVQQSSLLVQPDAMLAAERHLAVIQGLALTVESAEAVADTSRLIDAHGNLIAEPATPAERAMVIELVAHRTRLVHALLCQQSQAHRDQAAQRVEQHATYQQVIDDHTD
ncbi:hypothetical protein ACLM5J_12035 [Nocardioides sp. Bht2]|uniref:hypothetical protein n=1 Tax=Nocardioides sp. Bht2 TaxID=3392297 RepID=UPI0039B5AF04